jgi:glucokinase
MDGDCVLACDLGGTHLRVAALEAGGSVFFRREILTPKDDPTALARTMRFVLDNAGRTIVGAVVGVPGPVDYSRGRVIDLPNLPGWEDSISAAGLSQELDKEVLLANDADLAALGEHRFGAGRGYDDMVYVTSSTGVGAGVIIGGRLLHGRFSLAEVGHTIIDLTTGNTVESLGSGTALARLSGENPATVADRAKHGDLEALRQFSKVADAFAVGVFNLVHCFSPQLVVIGGGMSQAGELLLGPVREVLARCGPNCPASHPKVVRAEGGDDVGLLGGLAYWMDCSNEAIPPAEAPARGSPRRRTSRRRERLHGP